MVKIISRAVDYFINRFDGCRGIATGSEDPVWLSCMLSAMPSALNSGDRDCLFDDRPLSTQAAHAGHTVMACKIRPEGPPQFFTDYDIWVLRRIWGGDRRQLSLHNP